jgi:hypothetical protein
MAAAARLLLLRRAATAAAEAAAGRPSLLAPARRHGAWAAMSAAVAEAPRGAAPSSDFFAVLGAFGVPTALVVAATTGAFLAIRQFGELSAKVAASDKAIEAANAVSEAKMAANKEATSAVIAANKEATSAVIAANKEVAEAKMAATEVKLAAAEKVIAALIAGVPVAAELATLKALKGGEPKREEAPKSEPKEQGH